MVREIVGTVPHMTSSEVGRKNLVRVSSSIGLNITGVSKIILLMLVQVSRDASVGIVTGYRLDGRGSIPGRGKIFFSSPQRPDRLLGPPSLLSNG
jgi:hypothetical protein